MIIDQALSNLRPGKPWSVDGFDIEWEEILSEDNIPTGEFISKNLTWFDSSTTPLSKLEYEAEVARLEAEYVATEYQRLRKPEYPPLADLADALYWQAQGDETKMTAYLAAVEAVKQKYPKGV